MSKRRKRGPEEPYVVLRAEIIVTVELPEENKYNGQRCEDPAIDAVLEAMPELQDIYLWGEQSDPCRVFVEVHEDDVEVEEDSR